MELVTQPNQDTIDQFAISSDLLQLNICHNIHDHCQEYDDCGTSIIKVLH